MSGSESPTILLVAGLDGSGPGHWQEAWSRELPGCIMVEQASWNDPHRADWIARLDAAVATTPGPVAIVAHSLGCVATAWWADARPAGCDRVVAALLVAPCDVDRAGSCAAIARFRPMPVAPLPFRSTLVASHDDPYSSFARLRSFAQHWGSRFVDVGAMGHINAASDLGTWPFGQRLLDELVGERVGS
ncbi:MAG: RBBP9/YdeN family alpha/beta hydrolase [Janthinobacterium lividum]